MKMFPLLLLLIGTCLFSSTASQTISDEDCVLDVNVTDISNTNSLIVSKETALPCGKTMWMYNISEYDGSGLKFVINSLNVDSDNDDYMTLSTDRCMTGDISSVAYISGSLTNITLAFPSSQIFFIELVQSDGGGCASEFDISLSFLDPYVLPMTSPPPNYDPPQSIPTEIAVQFAGLTYHEFNELANLRKIKNYLKDAATTYCFKKELNCNLTKTPDQTIFFTDIKKCPWFWKNSETCVSAWLAVYVSEKKEPYQLNPSQLADFWDFVTSGHLLDGSGVHPYEHSDISIEILWWMLWIFVAIVAAGFAGFFFTKCAMFQVRFQAARREKEREEIQQKFFKEHDIERRTKTLSPYQVMPPFMTEGDDENSVQSVGLPSKHKFKSVKLFPPREVPRVEFEKAENIEMGEIGPTPLVIKFSEFFDNKAYDTDGESDEGEIDIFNKDSSDL